MARINKCAHINSECGDLMRFSKALMVVAILPLLASAPAKADSATMLGIEQGDGYVIIDTTTARSVRSDRGDFYPTGRLSPSTTVVITDDDGSLPAGLTRAAIKDAVSNNRSLSSVAAEQMETSAACSPCSFSASPFSWASYSDGIGHSAGYGGRMAYNFRVQVGTNQRAVGQGRGFYRGYNGGEMGVWAGWYGLGQSTGWVTAGAYVPWENTIATKRFMVKSSTTALATGKWW